MSMRKMKHIKLRALGRFIRARSIFWNQLERERELENAAMERIKETLPEFAAIFQTMPRLPMGWSLL